MISDFKQLKNSILKTNSTKPLILVTNDDGYFAPGLRELIAMVKPYGDVLVVAPEQGVSGMSHAITIKSPLRTTLLEQSEKPMEGILFKLPSMAPPIVPE